MKVEKIDVILLKLFPTDESGQIGKKYTETIRFYKECKELIEKTYFALGRKKEYNFTTQSTTNGRIDTRTISTTTKI